MMKFEKLQVIQLFWQIYVYIESVSVMFLNGMANKNKYFCFESNIQ